METRRGGNSFLFRGAGSGAGRVHSLSSQAGLSSRRAGCLPPQVTCKADRALSYLNKTRRALEGWTRSAPPRAGTLITIADTFLPPNLEFSFETRLKLRTFATNVSVRPPRYLNTFAFVGFKTNAQTSNFYNEKFLILN